MMHPHHDPSSSPRPPQGGPAEAATPNPRSESSPDDDDDGRPSQASAYQRLPVMLRRRLRSLTEKRQIVAEQLRAIDQALAELKVELTTAEREERERRPPPRAREVNPMNAIIDEMAKSGLDSRAIRQALHTSYGLSGAAAANYMPRIRSAVKEWAAAEIRGRS